MFLSSLHSSFAVESGRENYWSGYWLCVWQNVKSWFSNLWQDLNFLQISGSSWSNKSLDYAKIFMLVDDKNESLEAGFEGKMLLNYDYGQEV